MVPALTLWMVGFQAHEGACCVDTCSADARRKAQPTSSEQKF